MVVRHFFIALICALGVLCSSEAQAQKGKFERKGDNMLARKQFDNALPIFLETYKEGPTAELEYKIGVCYFHSNWDKQEGIPYLERYIDHSDSLFEAHYFLAQLYHREQRFSEAIDQYKLFAGYVANDSLADAIMRQDILVSLGQEVQRCNYGKLLIHTPRDVIIENLGEGINTKYSEYAPVVAPAEDKMMFTARRPETTGGKISPDGDYFEDIYYSDFEDGSLFGDEVKDRKGAGYYGLLTRFKLTPPVNMGEPVNSKGHEGGVQFSYEGDKLYLYRDFNVWESKFMDTAWAEPAKIEGLDGIVNTKSYEPSVSLSADGSVMYIASDRPGGFGGLDIYKAEKDSTDTWLPAVNLGPAINSHEDEDSPYIDPDGVTLYFSSTGHSSMGGHDVFKTQWKGYGWTPPENMGFPINSPGDDIFFMMTPRYNRGYYSSDKRGGYGMMDLYRLTFADERSNLAEVKGLVLKGDSLLPTFSQFSIVDSEHNEELAKLHSDSVDGSYLLLFDHGKKYTINVETDGFVPYTKSFLIPPQLYYYRYYQEIHHIYLRDADGNIIGQQIVFNNAFFDIDSLIRTDTLYYGMDRIGAYREFLRRGGDTLAFQYKKLVDVKFYMTEDSLFDLMRLDSSLNFEFPRHSTVSFFQPKLKNTSINEVSAYVELKNRDAFFDRKILLGESATTEVLTEIFTPSTDLTTDESPPVPTIIVLFDYEESDVKPGEVIQLKVMADYIKQQPKQRFEVIGHTDSKGEEDFNMVLSYDRSHAVIEYLVKQGVHPDQLVSKGKGEGEPIASNENPDGSDNPASRKLNRRVEFKLIQ